MAYARNASGDGFAALLAAIEYMGGMSGSVVHMEVSSANAAGTALKFDIYPSGSTTARSVGGAQITAAERVTITDVVFVSTAGGAWQITAGGTGGAGTLVAKGNAEALGGLAYHFATPLTLPAGVWPYITAAAGQIDCVLSGFVT